MSTAKASNKTSQETTAKRKRDNLKKKSANLFRGPSETTGPFYYNSYWFQLITHSAGRTILASHSSLRSLLSARTKLRTTGLLTGRGKVMRLLACHLWGDRMAANGPDGKGVFPCVSYFTSLPNLQLQYRSTITSFLSGRPNALLHQWGRPLPPGKQKVVWYMRGLECWHVPLNETSSVFY